MIIAVTCQGSTLADLVDSRFGRAAGFIFYDTESGAFEAVPNLQNLNAAQGAGVQAALNVVDRRAQAVITGHCGPKAFRVLQAAGVQVHLWQGGTVQAALDAWRSGALGAAASPDVPGHWA